MNKLGKTELQSIAMIAIIGLALLVGYQYFTGGGISGTPSGGGTGNTVNVNANTCADSASVTLGYGKDKYTPTTSYTGEFHRVLLNGNDLGLFADGTARSFSKGDQVTIYTAFNATQVYSKEMKFTVGCDGAYTASGLPSSLEVTGADGRDAFQLVANSTSVGNTITFYDENSNPQTADTNTQAIGAGQRKTLQFKFEAPSKMGFSPNRKVFMACDVNKTLFQDLNGIGDVVETTAVPQSHTRVAAIGLTASGDYTTYGFEFPGVVDNSAFVGKIEFVADSTNNPDGLGNVTCTFYDQDYYKHSITGAIQLGYETDLRANVGAANPTATWRFS